MVRVNSAKKFMGLDFGDKTIGVSVSLDGRVATGVTTIKRTGEDAFKPALKQLKELIRKYKITHVLLGNPLLMNGDESQRVEKTLVFKDKLLKYVKSLSVEMWDERLSTQAVSRVYEGRKEDYKNHVDEMAAVYILQGYLDFINGGGKIMPDEHLEELGDDAESLVVVNEDGEERPLQILSSREDESGIYLLAIDEDGGEVFIFKCQPSEDDPEDLILEQIDDEHENYKHVLAMFGDDFEEFGIDIDIE